MATVHETNRDALLEGTMRDHVIDGAKASPVVGYLLAWASGVTLADWATFLAIIYTSLMIIDKLRHMAWFRHWIASCLARLHPKR